MSHTAFRTAVERHDLKLIRASLAHDVVVHSPVTARPFQGRDVVTELVWAARAGVLGFEYTDEILADGMAGLIFRGRIKGRPAEGMDLVRFNRSGLVADLTVMIRPLFAASAFNEVMAPVVAELMGQAS
ncbi:hypothetical protein BLA60_35295 [Actinophytocola xinjiangensis]|uniref:SnoaL-like domain-containing protein n=1 Tax=Actinophytocola xinjiangensis TaxID=485602 RepID=A0A7Z0WHZ2_9PSEU|nr:nuclear transport factor 2 family protein [Actinophytocola xinjiangensis]OLF05773.1 hypothetical protein BLA60_35295 [Actinophytocola xinjiangensis]